MDYIMGFMSGAIIPLFIFIYVHVNYLYLTSKILELGAKFDRIKDRLDSK